MKAPALLAARWHKQWQQHCERAERLLNPQAWPISLSIGRPTPQQFARQTREVREHVKRWRQVSVGEIVWESVSFRAASEPVDIPTAWILRNASQWVAAIGDPIIERDFRKLMVLLPQVDPQFHSVLIRHARLICELSEESVLKAVHTAQVLEPGCAAGKPLRALAIAGNDSKFMERHRALVLKLLDERFEGQPGELGLEAFLDALDEGDHWLLVAPLEKGLLPFKRQSVPATDLMGTALPGTHLLIVENERCLHQLPAPPGTVAVLGSGLNLAWMQVEWLREKAIGYWGDLDTWGLTMLATARVHQPKLEALLMDQHTFEAHAALAVCEPYPSSDLPPDALSDLERILYLHLRHAEKGRLEQEFIPRETVTARLSTWQFKTAV
jgi:hypothetical protein